MFISLEIVGLWGMFNFTMICNFERLWVMMSRLLIYVKELFPLNAISSSEPLYIEVNIAENSNCMVIYIKFY